jgi:hypothetical protein
MLDESKIIEKGALRAGQCVTMNLANGQLDFLDPQDRPENRDARLETHLTSLPYRNPDEEAFEADDMFLFGVQEEELAKMINPMIAEGKEPIGSMGDTAAPAILSDQPRSFFDYFYKCISTLTNFSWHQEKITKEMPNELVLSKFTNLSY